MQLILYPVLLLLLVALKHDTNCEVNLFPIFRCPPILVVIACGCLVTHLPEPPRRWPPNESETEDDNLIWPYFNTSRAASELHTDNN